MGRRGGLLVDLNRQGNWTGYSWQCCEKKNRPASGILVTAQVDSGNECFKKIVAAGGSIVVPKRTIPGAGYPAHFQDPEGNGSGFR